MKIFFSIKSEVIRARLLFNFGPSWVPAHSGSQNGPNAQCSRKMFWPFWYKHREKTRFVPALGAPPAGCLPTPGNPPRVPKSMGAWAPPGPPQVLKRSLFRAFFCHFRSQIPIYSRFLSLRPQHSHGPHCLCAHRKASRCRCAKCWIVGQKSGKCALHKKVTFFWHLIHVN